MTLNLTIVSFKAPIIHNVRPILRNMSSIKKISMLYKVVLLQPFVKVEGRQPFEELFSEVAVAGGWSPVGVQPHP